MDSNTIGNILEKILRVQFGFDDEINEEDWNSPLTGAKFGFGAIQMFQFLMCVEESCSLYFSPEEIAKYQFSSINDILFAIETRKKNIEENDNFINCSTKIGS